MAADVSPSIVTCGASSVITLGGGIACTTCVVSDGRPPRAATPIESRREHTTKTKKEHLLHLSFVTFPLPLVVIAMSATPAPNADVIEERVAEEQHTTDSFLLLVRRCGKERERGRERERG
jgi:hypothetical protein